MTKKQQFAHKHDHCEHEHVKYCRQCDKPHCLDCGFEWNKFPYQYYYGLASTSAPTIYGTSLGGGTNTQGSRTALGTLSTTSVVATNCKHSELK